MLALLLAACALIGTTLTLSAGQDQLMDIYILFGLIALNAVLPGLLQLPWYLPLRIKRFFIKDLTSGKLQSH